MKKDIDPAKRRKGNIICAVVTLFFCAVLYFQMTGEKEEALPEPEVHIASVIQGKKLSLDCILPGEIDAATLEKIAKKTYTSKAGSSFDNVFIMWYLPGEKIGAGAWATSNKHGKDAALETKILRLQQMQKQAEAAAK